SIDVTVNDRPAGTIGPLMPTSTINRDGIRGYWQEKAVAFDASLMKQGTNMLKLTIPRGGPMSGVMYDYLRLELDEPAGPTAFIVGDSTVKTGTRGQQGWGDPIAKLFDTTKIKVENHAIGGRSSRTFQTEGRWDRILAKAKPGRCPRRTSRRSTSRPRTKRTPARRGRRGTRVRSSREVGL